MKVFNNRPGPRHFDAQDFFAPGGYKVPVVANRQINRHVVSKHGSDMNVKSKFNFFFALPSEGSLAHEVNLPAPLIGKSSEAATQAMWDGMRQISKMGEMQIEENRKSGSYFAQNKKHNTAHTSVHHLMMDNHFADRGLVWLAFFIGLFYIVSVL